MARFWQDLGMQESTEISRHQLLIVRALAGGEWQTNQQIAESTGVARRTVRLHTLRLVSQGIAEVAQVFPGHRYRLVQKASRQNHPYWDRLVRAGEALGITIAR